MDEQLIFKTLNRAPQYLDDRLKKEYKPSLEVEADSIAIYTAVLLAYEEEKAKSFLFKKTPIPMYARYLKLLPEWKIILWISIGAEPPSSESQNQDASSQLNDPEFYSALCGAKSEELEKISSILEEIETVNNLTVNKI